MKAKVYLVGAGPGDPGLITVHGRACIQSADVIIYDYLASPVLLKYARKSAELIYVGKKGGDHTLSQDQIEAASIDGIPRIYAFSPLAGPLKKNQIILVTSIPSKIAFADANRNLARNLSLLGVATLLALLFVWKGNEVFILRQVRAMAAASRATTILAKDSVKISPLVSQIDVEKCIGCGLCAEVCAFAAIELEEVEGKGYRAKNISASCFNQRLRWPAEGNHCHWYGKGTSHAPHY